MSGRTIFATALCAVLPSALYLSNSYKGTAKASIDPLTVENCVDCEYPADRWISAENLSVIVDGEAIRQYPARGKIYIEATEGREYSLRVHNPFDVRVAVALSVDGLNTIDARHTSAFDSSKWVIPAYGDVTITGWQMSSNRARKFYFTPEDDSYGAKLGQTANLGVISAAFFRERRTYPYQATPGKDSSNKRESEVPYSAGQASPNADSSEAKSSSRAARPRNDDYASTGIGRSVHNDVNWVSMDLERTPAAEVNLRYEFRPELIRLGVLPRPYYPDPVYRRENASGFGDRRYAPEP